MRITNSMLTDTILRNLNNNLKRLNRLQEQMSSGKTVSKPSDDPVYVSRIMRLQTMIQEQEKYQQNMKDAQGFVDSSEASLNSVTGIMNRARELAVYGANGSLTDSDRDTLAAEVDELINEMVEVANSSYEGRYIFGGYKTTTPPFERSDALQNAGITAGAFNDGYYTITFESSGNAVLRDSQGNNIATTTYSNGTAETITFDDGLGNQLELTKDNSDVSGHTMSIQIEGSKVMVSGVAYKGDEGKLEWEVARGVTMSVSLQGQELFLISGVFLSLERLKSGLENNDAADLGQNVIGGLDQAANNILAQRAVLGAKSNRLSIAQDRAFQGNINLTELLSRLEDVDWAEVVMKFKTAENVYRAALATGAQVMQPTLLDYLR